MWRSLVALALGGSALLAQQPGASPSPDFQAPQSWFQWKKFARVQPRTLTFQAPPASRACAVPLLAVPVDPNAGANMPMLQEPKENIHNMPIAKGLPPCASPNPQTELLVIPKPRPAPPQPDTP